MIVFHQSCLHFNAFSFPLWAYNLFVTLGNKIYIEFNYIKMYIRYEIVPICPYHFVRTILSNTILSLYHFVCTINFCPLPFCPVTLWGHVTRVARGDGYASGRLEVIEPAGDDSIKLKPNSLWFFNHHLVEVKVPEVEEKVSVLARSSSSELFCFMVRSDCRSNDLNLV